MRRVVVLGSGFAGIQIAQRLADEFAARRGLQLTIVTDRSHFLFTPLWGSAATGAVSLAQIAIPLQRLVGDHVDIVIDRATEIDLVGREVVGTTARYAYDFLIVAVGTEIDWRGHPEFERWAMPCKSGRDAVDVYEAVDEAFARARDATDPTARRRALTFTVAGGGPTGVELMAKIASRLEWDVLRAPENRGLRRDVRLVLVEPQASLLPEFPPDLQPIALDHLRAAGVDVRLSDSVVDVAADRVELASGDAIACETVLWCGGVRPPRWLAETGFDTDLRGRVTAHRTLQVAGHHNVYVAGDVAGVGDDVPMKASVAVSQAAVVARNVIADLSGRSRRDWEGAGEDEALISLGRSNAAVSVRGMLLQGRPAQAVWGGLSARLLPEGFRRLTMIRSLLGDAFSPRIEVEEADLLPE